MEWTVERDYAREALPKRSPEGHKGSFGEVLVLAGSVGYTGAAWLTAEGAVRGGCGLVHLGVPEEEIPLLAEQSASTIPCMMPYIAAFFMPRNDTDRPQVVPEHAKNFAFIGQFVELEGDVVFTVETSVRTAMIAVYRMLLLDRPITPLFQGQYDIRMVNVALRTLLGKDKIEVSDLPKVNPLKLPQTMHEIVNAINQIPPVPEYYSERKENQ